MIVKLKMFIQKHSLFLTLGLVVLMIAFIASRVNMVFWGLETRGSDTYYSWVEGKRILDGSNPYERILHGNMQENRKYATYFPLFYEASALAQLAGYRRYDSWIDFYRYIFLACNLLIGFALYVFAFSKRAWALSLVAAFFWYFNRWTLMASKIVAIDFIPILFMIVSLGIFERYRRASLLLFSLSLAIKQIAIFIAPLYLIWEYQQSRSLKKTVIAGLWILSIPLLTSIPFLVWNAEGFIKSIAFSATREAASTRLDWDSVDVILHVGGLLARLPILALLLGAYITSWQKTLGRYAASLLVMAIFLAFNPVLFVQYFAWLMPLIPMVASELMIKTSTPDVTSNHREENLSQA